MEEVAITPDHPDQPPRWPPPWLAPAAPILAAALAPASSEVDQDGGREAATSAPPEAVPADAPPEGATPAVPPSPEFEALFAATEAEVRRLTSDPKMLRVAANLLNDCRDMWREGRHTTALFLARDYTRRIPAYIRMYSTEGTRRQ